MVPDTPQHRFALLDDTGKAICIDQISRSFGQSHKFFCPHCKSEMYATYGENKQVPHFRHNGVSCEYNNYLHTLAEFIFIEEYEKCLREGFPFNFNWMTSIDVFGTVSKSPIFFEPAVPVQQPPAPAPAPAPAAAPEAVA